MQMIIRTASAKAYTDAKKALSDLIEADNTTRVNPDRDRSKESSLYRQYYSIS